MMVSIVALHVLGFFILIAFVVPGHYKNFGIGLGAIAYTLGMRHAFDADHIRRSTTPPASCSTNGTALKERAARSHRLLLLTRHSTIVVAIGIGMVFASGRSFTPYRTVTPGSSSSAASSDAGLGVVPFLIGLMNIVILAGIYKVFRSMRDGTYDEAELEAQLQNAV